LDRYALRGKHLVLQRGHACGGAIDVADERDRRLQDRLQPLAILDARVRVFVLDDERCVCDLEREQLARRELIIEPVDDAVLQVGERIVPGRARELVLGEDRLFLPRMDLIASIASPLSGRGRSRKL
jgi:hypothetical protein